MGRRTHKAEMEFGSDSFLDVIANIVGILIILIVIAGLRVGQAPAPTLTEEEAKAADISGDSHAGPASPTNGSAVTESEEELEPLDENFEPPADLALRMKEIEEEIAALEREADEQASAVEALEARQESEKQELTATEQTVAAQAADRNRQRRRLGRLRQTVEERKGVLAELIAQIASLKKTVPPVKKIEHRVTPIARAVQGDEIHFRLAEGKVSIVPLKELINRLLKQAESQKEWLVQFRKHEGTVGPIGGFSMLYMIERQQASVADQIHRGPGTFRVGVTAFKVIPEPKLKAETIQQASKVGSEFHIALQSAKPGSTLTFWVYPDSYTLYRKLQSLAHDSGFTVAARPLPFGVPIAGSPSGTRSAGQ